MYYLAVSLYELGQFLRIVLCITLPLFVIATLLTTWLHYKRRRAEAGLLLYIEGGEGDIDGEGMVHEENERVSEPHAEHTNQALPETLDEGMKNENMYKGLLWMKEKYEQYQEQADRKYDKLRVEVELLRVQTPPTPSSAAENLRLRELLEEKDRQIRSLQQQLGYLQSPLADQTGLGQ